MRISREYCYAVRFIGILILQCLFCFLTYYIFMIISIKFGRNSIKQGNHFRIDLLHQQSLESSKSSKEVDIFNSSTIAQDDPRVINYIREKHLFPPSNKERTLRQQYFFNLDKDLANILESILQQKMGGFFVECGANNGEFLSSTLELEMKYNWTGLLIESSPSLFKDLQKVQRKAWTSDVCLSGSHPMKLEFFKHKDVYPYWRIGNGRVETGTSGFQEVLSLNYIVLRQVFSINAVSYLSAIVVYMTVSRKDYISEGWVDCFPLFSLLTALGVRTVDLFSLDVEGHEYSILKGIPFNRLDIRVIFVEHAGHSVKDCEDIKALLLSNNYKLAVQTTTDFIFTKNV